MNRGTEFLAGIPHWNLPQVFATMTMIEDSEQTTDSRDAALLDTNSTVEDDESVAASHTSTEYHDKLKQVDETNSPKCRPGSRDDEDDVVTKKEGETEEQVKASHCALRVKDQLFECIQVFFSPKQKEETSVVMQAAVQDTLTTIQSGLGSCHDQVDAVLITVFDQPVEEVQLRASLDHSESVSLNEDLTVDSFFQSTVGSSSRRSRRMASVTRSDNEKDPQMETGADQVGEKDSPFLDLERIPTTDSEAASLLRFKEELYSSLDAKLEEVLSDNFQVPILPRPPSLGQENEAHDEPPLQKYYTDKYDVEGIDRLEMRDQHDVNVHDLNDNDDTSEVVEEPFYWDRLPSNDETVRNPRGQLDTVQKSDMLHFGTVDVTTEFIQPVHVNDKIDTFKLTEERKYEREGIKDSIVEDTHMHGNDDTIEDVQAPAVSPRDILESRTEEQSHDARHDLLSASVEELDRLLRTDIEKLDRIGQRRRNFARPTKIQPSAYSPPGVVERAVEPEATTRPHREQDSTDVRPTADPPGEQTRLSPVHHSTLPMEEPMGSRERASSDQMNDAASHSTHLRDNRVRYEQEEPEFVDLVHYKPVSAAAQWSYRPSNPVERQQYFRFNYEEEEKEVIDLTMYDEGY